MKKYKYIFFDVADTLLYKPALHENIAKTLLQFDIQIDSETIRRQHKSISEIIEFPTKTSHIFYHNFNKLLLISLGILPSQSITEAIYYCCKEISWEPFPDTCFLYEFPIKTGIISNWDERLESFLKKYFSVDFFKIVSSNNIGFAKPDISIFIAAIKDLECMPKEILYVGDSIRLDILPAMEIGMKAVLIDRYNLYPNYNDMRINSLKQLRSIL